MSSGITREFGGADGTRTRPFRRPGRRNQAILHESAFEDQAEKWNHGGTTVVPVSKAVLRSRIRSGLRVPIYLRLHAFTRRSGSCLLWVGGARYDGYGIVFRDGVYRQAHRAAWEIVNGPIPAGLCVLHRCDTPACVEPSHLFLGTKRDNALDSVAKGRHHNKNKTNCKHGHPLNGGNVYMRGHRRECRTCRVRNNRRSKP